MPSHSSELQASFATALKGLEARIRDLDTALIEEARYPLWVWKTERGYAERDYARAIIRSLDFIQGQDANETRVCPALMGVSYETLAAARAVNAYKAKLKTVIRQMKAYEGELPEGAESLIKHELGRMGRKHFHVRQAVREIVVLDRIPDKVSFTWARFNKVTRVTRDQLVKRIRTWVEQRGLSPDREHDLDILAGLRADEELAEVRPPHIHPRANLLTRAWDATKGMEVVVRPQVRAVLPILYPANPGDRVPLHRALPLEPPKDEKRSRGEPRKAGSSRRVRLDDTPILRSLPVYRYAVVSSEQRLSTGHTKMIDQGEREHAVE